MKFFEICAEVIVPKFTRAEVRLPVINLELKNTKLTFPCFLGVVSVVLATHISDISNIGD